MAVYSLTRWTRQVSLFLVLAAVLLSSLISSQLLRRHRKRKPSLVVHLFASQFRLEHTNGVFPYADSPMKAILEAIRDQRIPTHVADVLGQANIPFYDGCLIVQVHDHRHLPQNGPTESLQPHVYRIVLAPDLDTIHTDLADGTNDPESSLEVEAAIRALTSPKLCLSPDVAATRVANDAIRATTLDPRSLADRPDPHGAARQRRLSLDESQSANPADAHHIRLMRIGDDSQYRTFTPTFTRHSFIESWKQHNSNNANVANNKNGASSNTNNNSITNNIGIHTSNNNNSNTTATNLATPAPTNAASASLQQEILSNVRKQSTPILVNQASSIPNSRKRARQDSEPLVSTPAQPPTPSPALSAIGIKPKPVKQTSRQQRLKDNTRRISSLPQQQLTQPPIQLQQQKQQQQHGLVPQSATDVLSQPSSFAPSDLPVGVGLPENSLPVGVGLDFSVSRPQMPSSSFNWAP